MRQKTVHISPTFSHVALHLGILTLVKARNMTILILVFKRLLAAFPMLSDENDTLAGWRNNTTTCSQQSRFLILFFTFRRRHWRTSSGDLADNPSLRLRLDAAAEFQEFQSVRYLLPVFPVTVSEFAVYF